MLRKSVAAGKKVAATCARSIGTAVERNVDPARDRARILAGDVHDAVRPRSELIAENALLRQQLIVVRRKIKRPVKPDTLLRWHRDLFKVVVGTGSSFLGWPGITKAAR
jgi:hypothetical protein